MTHTENSLFYLFNTRFFLIHDAKVAHLPDITKPFELIFARCTLRNNSRLLFLAVSFRSGRLSLHEWTSYRFSDQNVPERLIWSYIVIPVSIHERDTLRQHWNNIVFRRVSHSSPKESTTWKECEKKKEKTFQLKYFHYRPPVIYLASYISPHAHARDILVFQVNQVNDQVLYWKCNNIKSRFS